MDLMEEIELEVMVDRVSSVAAKGTQALDTSLPSIMAASISIRASIMGNMMDRRVF